MSAFVEASAQTLADRVRRLQRQVRRRLLGVAAAMLIPSSAAKRYDGNAPKPLVRPGADLPILRLMFGVR